MIWFLAALLIWLLSGLTAVLFRTAHRAGAIAVGGVVVGSMLAAIPTIQTLLGTAPPPFHQPWSIPYGSLYLALDSLSAYFMVPLLILSTAGAVYGWGYWKDERRPTGPAWCFYNLLVASMALVLVARNGMLFLAAWEVMALVSYFLVVFHSESPEVQKAGWIYLLATHLGAGFLLPMFILLGNLSHSLDFDRIGAAGSLSPALATLVFVLAVIGFGSKAGILGLHVWLPEAHPAAPSHVSALMSGVMIKLGIYGLLRVLILLGHPSLAWGWALVVLGLASGIYGLLLSLVQRDLKKLLAYSSVENIGIIVTALGIGTIGLASGYRMVALLGFSAALLHVVNHAMFKGLLFLCAGAVQHSTGTRDIEHLGGLFKTMPRTGAAFLVGAAAISGLPPLNGFISELSLYLAAFWGGMLADRASMAAFLLVAACLALIGGIAIAGFARAFGIVFLGAPRSVLPLGGHDPGRAMLRPMALLAALCVLLGLGAPLVLPALSGSLAQIAGIPAAGVTARLGVLRESFLGVEATMAVVALAFFALWLLRRRLLVGRPACRALTWGCGYSAPSPRMQYTGSSFAMPLVMAFQTILGGRHEVKGLDELFPVRARWTSQTSDAFRTAIFGRLFSGLQRAISRLRWIQHGNLQVYVLYIAVTLLVLMIWKLGI